MPYQGVNTATKAWFIPEKSLIVHALPLSSGWQQGDFRRLLEYTEQAAGKQLKVVHLWQDVWLSQQAVIESRLLSILGKTERIHGRKTKARRIDFPQLQAFLQENHLQASTKAKYKYGLFLGNELVGVASFGPMLTIERDGKPYLSGELIRFCTKAGYTVVGGLSKLLQAFIKDRAPQHLMTYADRDWSVGSSYERLGFERVGEIPPQEFWVNPGTFERHATNRLPGPIPANWVRVGNTGSWKYVYWVKK